MKSVKISIHSGTKPETSIFASAILIIIFQFTPAQSQRQQFYPNNPIINHHFYTKYPIFHLHPLIPLPKQITNHSFISANPSIYLCSLTFRTTLYCFIITPSLQLFQKHFLLFPPQRILGSLTAEQKKNTCRPHKACIFLSNFIHLVVAIYGYI